MDDLKKITEQVEYLFLKKLAAGLQGETIDIKTAKDSAQQMLDLLPFSSFDDAKVKVQGFTQRFPFSNNLNDFINGYHEELKKHATIEKMRAFMREGDIDQAINTAKE